VSIQPPITSPHYCTRPRTCGFQPSHLCSAGMSDISLADSSLTAAGNISINVYSGAAPSPPTSDDSPSKVPSQQDGAAGGSDHTNDDEHLKCGRHTDSQHNDATGDQTNGDEHSKCGCHAELPCHSLSHRYCCSHFRHWCWGGCYLRRHHHVLRCLHITCYCHCHCWFCSPTIFDLMCCDQPGVMPDNETKNANEIKDTKRATGTKVKETKETNDAKKAYETKDKELKSRLQKLVCGRYNSIPKPCRTARTACSTLLALVDQCLVSDQIPVAFPWWPL